jgi:hypothetical protein
LMIQQQWKKRTSIRTTAVGDSLAVRGSRFAERKIFTRRDSDPYEKPTASAGMAQTD